MTRERRGGRGRPGGWLLLRHRGSLWGVAHDTLKELTRSRPTRLELKSGSALIADELLNLAADLESHPFPRCARRFFAQEIYGLAVWHGEPVILVEPNTPPACLSAGAGATENPEMDVHGES